ncbi:unnamed protein product [Urochloa humidicola]
MFVGKESLLELLSAAQHGWQCHPGDFSSAVCSQHCNLQGRSPSSSGFGKGPVVLAAFGRLGLGERRGTAADAKQVWILHCLQGFSKARCVRGRGGGQMRACARANWMRLLPFLA